MIIIVLMRVYTVGWKIWTADVHAGVPGFVETRGQYRQYSDRKEGQSVSSGAYA